MENIPSFRYGEIAQVNKIVRGEGVYPNIFKAHLYACFGGIVYFTGPEP